MFWLPCEVSPSLRSTTSLNVIADQVYFHITSPERGKTLTFCFNYTEKRVKCVTNSFNGYYRVFTKSCWVVKFQFLGKKKKMISIMMTREIFRFLWRSKSRWWGKLFFLTTRFKVWTYVYQTFKWMDACKHFLYKVFTVFYNQVKSIQIILRFFFFII